MIARCLLALALLLAGVASTGCGTAFSRSRHDFLGAYPFEGVAADALMVVGVINPDNEAVALYGLISLPIDLVVDLVLLPADLVAWAFGQSKARPRRDDAPGPVEPIGQSARLRSSFLPSSDSPSLSISRSS